MSDETVFNGEGTWEISLPEGGRDSSMWLSRDFYGFRMGEGQAGDSIGKGNFRLVKRHYSERLNRERLGNQEQKFSLWLVGFIRDQQSDLSDFRLFFGLKVGFHW